MALWTPAKLANSKAWFVGDNPANTVASGFVTMLADKSAGAFNATVLGANANNKAVSTNTLNGRAIWTGTGGGGASVGAFIIGNGAVALSNAASGFSTFVMHSVSAGGTMASMSKNGDSTRSRVALARSQSAGGDLEYGIRRLDSDSYTAINNGATYGGTWFLGCGIVDYSGGVGSTFMDGVVKANASALPSSGLTSATDTASATIGCYDAGSPGDPVTGSMAEVLFIRGALTTTERQLVEGYMMWAWGRQASLPAGHPYLSVAPTDSNIIEADAAVTGDGALLWTAGKILAGIYAEADDATNAYLGAKILGTVLTDTPQDVEVWAASAVSSMVGAMLLDNAEPFAGSAIGAGVWDGSSSNNSDFQSNVIASGAGDLTCDLDGMTLWIGGGIAGMVADVQGQTNDLFVSGQITAAAFGADDLDAQDVFVAGFILTAMATLIGDCLVQWSTATFPGDHGDRGPSGSLRRLQRNPTSRVMVRVGPIRKMTR